MIVNRCLLYVFVRVELRFPLYLPPTAVLGTAFAIFPICRLSLRYTCDRISFFSIYRLSPLQTNDRIRNSSHLQIIFCATPPLRLCMGMLTGRINPCMDNEYSRGLRREMQASFRHQAHCLSDSEFGRLADNRRMQRVANAAVLQVHIRDKPTVTPHHIHSYNAYLRPFFSCFRIPPGGLFSPSILLK